MRKTLFLLLAVFLIVSPALAITRNYDAPSGKAISILTITTNEGNSGSFALYQANNNTITGTFGYTSGFPKTATASIGDSGEISFSYLTPGTLTIGIWPLSNVTHSSKIRLGLGQTAGWYNNDVDSAMEPSPIIGYSITSSNEVTTNVVLVGSVLAQESLKPTNSDDLLYNLQTKINAVMGFFNGVIYWLNFLFVQNLVLLIVLYFTGTMAYAANSSRNIFQFYKTWFRQQAGIFRFMAEMFTTVYNFLINVFNAVTKWI